MVFDLSTGGRVQGRVLGSKNAKSVVFSQPEGRRLAVVRHGYVDRASVDIWERRRDGSSYEKARAVDLSESDEAGDDSCARAAGFSRDGIHIALLAGKRIQVLDLATNRQWRVTTPSFVDGKSILWSPRDSTIFVGATDPDQRWFEPSFLSFLVDAENSRAPRVLKRTTLTVTAACFTDDGRRVAICLWDGAGYIYDVITGTLQIALPATTRAWRQPYWDDSRPWWSRPWWSFSRLRRLGGGGDDQGDNNPRLRHRWGTRNPLKIHFSLDGKLVATHTSDGSARLFDAATGHHLRTFTHGDGPRPPSILSHLRRIFKVPPVVAKRCDLPWTLDRAAKDLLIFTVVYGLPVASFLFSATFADVVATPIKLFLELYLPEFLAYYLFFLSKVGAFVGTQFCLYFVYRRLGIDFTPFVTGLV